MTRYLEKYKDGLLFLVLIPVINTINYHLTYARIRWDWYTYATYAIDTASGFIAWWIIRKTILWLDRTMPYEKGPLKRIWVQIALTNIFAQGFIIAQTEIVNALYTDEPLPTAFYTYNLFIFFIWILVINGVYTGMYFFDQWRNTQSLRDKDRAVRQAGFEVRVGNKIKTVAFAEIAAFYAEAGVVYLLTASERKYVLERSLNKLGTELPEELFYRLNRAYIVNRAYISGYEKDVNGKLIASLRTLSDLPETLVISRLTAPAFKKWLRASTQPV